VLLDPGELRVAGSMMLAAGLALPVLPGHPSFHCPLRTLTGLPCPLCGLSTSVEQTVRLHLGDAVAANPLGVLLVLAAFALLVVRPARLVLPKASVPAVLAASWLFELHRFSFL
jgi:Protein of unknown function (DUF2752)